MPRDCPRGGQRAARRIVQDVARGWRQATRRRHRLEGAVQQMPPSWKSYGVTTVCGDRYARGWVAKAFSTAWHSIRRRHRARQRRRAAVSRSEQRPYLETETASSRRASAPRSSALSSVNSRTLTPPQAGGKDAWNPPAARRSPQTALALAAAKARQGFVRPVAFTPDSIPRIGELCHRRGLGAVVTVRSRVPQPALSPGNPMGHQTLSVTDTEREKPIASSPHEHHARRMLNLVCEDAGPSDFDPASWLRRDEILGDLSTFSRGVGTRRALAAGANASAPTRLGCRR